MTKPSPNYSPFGSIMPTRVWSDASRAYRYGFNTQEKDNEVAGEGNSYTAEFWQYDGRLGRRFNLDPIDGLSKSNYLVFYNNPIAFIDHKGDKVKPADDLAFNAILNGLPPGSHKYVKLNRRGFIREGLLRRGIKKLNAEKGSNLYNLYNIVKDKRIIDVIVSPFVEYEDNEGNYKNDIMGPVGLRSEAENKWIREYKIEYEGKGKTYDDFVKDHPEFSTEKSIFIGTIGETVIDNPNMKSPGTNRIVRKHSTDGHIKIYINISAPSLAQANYFAHEAYGHVLFYINGKDWVHHGRTKPKEGDPRDNYELEMFILKCMKESNANFYLNFPNYKVL